MIEPLVFFVCDACGAMNMKNFRDDYCRVCRVTMKVSRVTVSVGLRVPGHFPVLSVESEPAPHTEESEE
jgi:hypothetical protein